MFTISGKYNQEQIISIIIKFLEQKKNQIDQKERLEQLLFKRQYKTGIGIIDSQYKKRITIFDAKNKYSHFILVGEPGSGKSSSVLNLYYKSIEEILNGNNNDLIVNDKVKGGIPIFIEMNMYNPSNDAKNWIHGAIVNDLRTFIQNVNVHELTDYFLMRGKLLILLDGLNEVSIKHIPGALKDIRELLLRYPNNKIVITMREQDYKGYFSIPVLTMLRLDAETVKEIMEIELANKKASIEEFYNLLDNRVKRLIQNPMLLMMFIYVLKEDSKIIHNNRGSLFNEFTEFWLEREEKKGIERTKDVDRIVRQSALSTLGFAMQVRGETRMSEEIVLEKLAKNLITLENKRIIRKGELGAVDVFNDVKSIGFVEENYGMVKFFHPSFMEYFAAVNLKNYDKSEILNFADEFNWEETINFYYGLIDDCSFFIEHFINQNRIFDASNCIVFGKSENEKLIENVINNLTAYLENKYEYYRIQAEDYLIKIDNPIVDYYLNKLHNEYKNEKGYSLYQDVLNKRNVLKDFELKEVSLIGEKGFVISEDKAEYQTEKEFSYLWNKFKNGELGEEFLERLEKYFIDNKQTEFFDNLSKIVKNNRYDMNVRLYALLYLEIILQKWGIEILLEIMTKRQIKKFIIDVEGLKETQIDKKYVFLNLLIDQRVGKELKRKLCVNHITDVEEEGLAFSIINYIEKYLDKKQKQIYDVYPLVVECLFKIDNNAAEEYLMFLFNQFQKNKIMESKLLEILKDKVISEKHYKFFTSNLKEEKESQIKQNIISAISNTRDSQFLIPLLSLIKNPEEQVKVKSKAIEAVGEIGDKNVIPVLKELSVDENPEIFNPAFSALKKIEKRSAFEERYIMRTDLREVEVEDELVGSTFYKEEKKFPKVKIYRDNKDIIEIENVVINLGPISGLVFYLIAVNTRVDKPINIDTLSKKLNEFGFYIDKNIIKGRIAYIRKKIIQKMKDKVDPHFLIENVRKFGYRINASITIE